MIFRLFTLIFAALLCAGADLVLPAEKMSVMGMILCGCLLGDVLCHIISSKKQLLIAGAAGAAAVIAIGLVQPSGPERQIALGAGIVGCCLMRDPLSGKGIQAVCLRWALIFAGVVFCLIGNPAGRMGRLFLLGLCALSLLWPLQETKRQKAIDAAAEKERREILESIRTRMQLPAVSPAKKADKAQKTGAAPSLRNDEAAGRIR